MSYIIADNPTEQRHFNYLEQLRKSGATNMWGAAPLLRKAFPKDFPPKTGFHDAATGAVLVKWMQLHEKASRIADGPNGYKQQEGATA